MIRNTIRNTIQNTIRNTLGDDAFNMLDLFSGGQRGVWYDPSDLATMFQESTGGTPVTADGQPVGLVLDKSQDGALGSELVTNGTFDTDSDWNLGAGDSIANGQLTIGTTTAFITQPFTFINGKTYRVTVDVIADDFRNVRFPYDGKVENIVYIPESVGTHTLTFVSGGSSTLFFGYALTANDAVFDNVSVKEVLGNHASQPVSTKRPTYKDTPDRLEIDLVDDALLFDVPTGGIDGHMVVGTNDGTASYGVSLPAGSYELGGDYFPSNTINGFLLREGAVSKSDLSKVEKDFISKGAKASYGDVTNFTNYWRQKNITEFPLVDTSSGTNFFAAWFTNNLTSFPLIDTSSGTSFYAAWQNNNLTSFPLIDTSSGTTFSRAWRDNNLTSFPLIDTSSGTNFQDAWNSNNLTSFPLIDTSSGAGFAGAWYGNNLTEFPLLDTSSGTNFSYAWSNNNTLADFPANMFDNCLATDFLYAFLNTGLSQASIDNILISINSNGTSNGTFDQSGGSAPSAAGEAAIDGLVTRGWTVTVTGGYQGRVLPQALFENDENGFWYNMGIN